MSSSRTRAARGPVATVVLGAWMAVVASEPTTWLTSALVELPLLIVAAVAVVSERRAGVRRLALIALIVLFALWMCFDGGWRLDGFHARNAGWTMGEAAIVLVFLETRLARWSVLPLIGIVVEAIYYVMSIYSGTIGDRRLSWLTFAAAALLANAALRDRAFRIGPGPGGSGTTARGSG